MTRTRPIGDDGAEAPAPLSSGASAAAGAGRRSPSRRLVVTCSKRQQGHLSGYSEATGPRGLWGRAPGVLGVLGARALGELGAGAGGRRGPSQQSRAQGTPAAPSCPQLHPALHVGRGHRLLGDAGASTMSGGGLLGSDPRHPGHAARGGKGFVLERVLYKLVVPHRGFATTCFIRGFKSCVKCSQWFLKNKFHVVNKGKMCRLQPFDERVSGKGRHPTRRPRGPSQGRVKPPQEDRFQQFVDLPSLGHLPVCKRQDWWVCSH